MKKLSILFLVLMVILSGCGKTADNSQNTDNQSSQVETDNKKENKDQDEDKTGDNEKDESSKDSNEDKEEAPLDEIEAPKREEIKDGVKFTFKRLPVNAKEIEKIVDFKDEKNVSAMLLATLVRYVENKNDGIEMINVLKGPEDISNADISFLDNRFSDKKYLPKVYFEGATPENNYTPDEPWSVILYDDKIEYAEGYIRVYVQTAGADSPRAIVLRQKGDEWFIWDYPAIVTGVRLPANEDAWK